MKEELIRLLQEKAGLDASKASSVVDTILDFIKDHPEKLTAFLGEDAVENVTEKLGNLFGR